MGTLRQNNAAWMARRNAARAEDLAWLAETGETTEGAAKRLGISLIALEKWCRTNNHHDDWRRLVANETPAGRLRNGAIPRWRVA